MDEKSRGNPLGSVVDENTKIFGEIVTVFSGDVLGKMTELDTLTKCDFVRLSDLYDKYKDDILPSDNLYVVVTNGYSCTIYECGHIERGSWHIFANITGYD